LEDSTLSSPLYAGTDTMAFIDGWRRTDYYCEVVPNTIVTIGFCRS
jgi:hypothetical protein